MTSDLSSTLEVCIDNDVLYKLTHTLLYFIYSGLYAMLSCYVVYFACFCIFCDLFLHFCTHYAPSCDCHLDNKCIIISTSLSISLGGLVMICL